MKKEIVYTMPCETQEERENVQKMRQKLYAENRYERVSIYPNGLHEVRVIAEEKIIN